jgi:superfamily II DNA or RNA helicase
LQSLVVRLTPHGDGLSASVYVRPIALGTNHRPGQGPLECISSDDRGSVYCRRDFSDEEDRAKALMSLLSMSHSDNPDDLLCTDPEDALTMLTILHEQQEAGAVRIEWPHSTPWHVSSVAGSGMRIEVGSSPLGMHFEGDVDVDGMTLSLARLLDAAKEGKRFIALSDGRYAAMSADLRDRARQLVESSQRHGNKQVGGAAMAIALDGLQHVGVDVRGKTVWAQWQSRLAAAAAVGDVPSSLLLAEMRPYQRQGLQFLRRLQALGTGGVLADDMGLGKTIQAIAMLLDRQQFGAALVIAPTSVCINWGRELSRFAPSLRVLMVHDLVQRDALITSAGSGDVIVASYGLLTRSTALLGRDFATVIFDEAQAIKNSDAQRTQAARAVKAEFRVVLTGTPMENHLGELWSVFSVASPGLLPPADSFRARFQVPIERDKNRDAARTLQQLLRPFMLRRTKGAVAPELPPRTEVTHRIAPSPAERARYQALRQLLIEKVEASTLEAAQRRLMLLGAITRLRQMACHPALDEVGRDLAAQPSSKLIALQRMVVDLKAGGHRVLVFSQFTRLLDLVEPVLQAASLSFVRLDGSTSPSSRTRAVDAFQAGDADVFLISLKAGGFGLNLTAATYVIHLDPWWNPAVEAQATDRAHRMGQTRAVTVYRLITEGTIEETVLEMQDSKRALIASVLEDEGISAMGGKLSNHDLEYLLKDAATAEHGCS